jgi:hypothetical protein
LFDDEALNRMQRSPGSLLSRGFYWRRKGRVNSHTSLRDSWAMAGPCCSMGVACVPVAEPAEHRNSQGKGGDRVDLVGRWRALTGLVTTAENNRHLVELAETVGEAEPRPERVTRS